MCVREDAETALLRKQAVEGCATDKRLPLGSALLCCVVCTTPVSLGGIYHMRDLSRATKGAKAARRVDVCKNRSPGWHGWQPSCPSQTGKCASKPLTTLAEAAGGCAHSPMMKAAPPQIMTKRRPIFLLSTMASRAAKAAARKRELVNSCRIWSLYCGGKQGAGREGSRQGGRQAAASVYSVGEMPHAVLLMASGAANHWPPAA